MTEECNEKDDPHLDFEDDLEDDNDDYKNEEDNEDKKACSIHKTYHSTCQVKKASFNLLNLS